MRVKRLTTLLDLTPGEQTVLTELFTKNATADQPLMSSMRTAEQALRTAEKNNDSAGIQSASTQIGTITGQITANRASLNIGIEASLSPDQLAKYKALGPAAGAVRVPWSRLARRSWRPCRPVETGVTERRFFQLCRSQSSCSSGRPTMYVGRPEALCSRLSANVACASPFFCKCAFYGSSKFVESR